MICFIFLNLKQFFLMTLKTNGLTLLTLTLCWPFRHRTARDKLSEGIVGTEG